MLSPLQAIKSKCLECSCGSSNEVRICPIDNCPLYTYRLGHAPKKELTQDQKEVINTRMKKIRESISKNKGKNTI